MRLIGAHRKERINMAPDLAQQILDTPWQKQKYAMYWNIKNISINHFSHSDFGHLQFEGESHFRPP